VHDGEEADGASHLCDLRLTLADGHERVSLLAHVLQATRRHRAAGLLRPLAVRVLVYGVSVGPREERAEEVVHVRCGWQIAEMSERVS
jgi:hypothetical protein